MLLYARGTQLYDGGVLLYAGGVWLYAGGVWLYAGGVWLYDTMILVITSPLYNARTKIISNLWPKVTHFTQTTDFLMERFT